MALGRTVNSLNETTKIALATPGVKQVITIAGISVLDNSATLANAGVNYVIFDDWSKRGKAKGQDLKSLLLRLQSKIESIPDGRAFVLVLPPIGLEMRAVSRCSSSAAASPYQAQ